MEQIKNSFQNELKFAFQNMQNEVAVNYMRGTNFMMLGGLMLAVCVEHSGLHRRIALRIVLLMGTSPKMSMFGFMVTTAFVSMFISNAASTAMMVPIVEAFAEVTNQQSEVGFIFAFQSQNPPGHVSRFCPYSSVYSFYFSTLIFFPLRPSPKN